MVKQPKKREALQPTRIAPLREDELARVTGGEGGTTPRDPATGLPTGKRQ